MSTATSVREKLETTIYDAVRKFGGSISMDCWLDKTKKSTFFGMTAHFIEEAAHNFVLHDRIMCTRELHTDTKDGIYCRQKLLEYLESYNLTELIGRLVFISDRGKNIVKALEIYESINCFAHILNNAVIKMLEEIAASIMAVKALVKYFKVTGLNSSLGETLKSYVPTRWNSVYYMLRSVIANWDAIICILTSKAEMRRIENIDLSTLRVCC